MAEPPRYPYRPAPLPPPAPPLPPSRQAQLRPGVLQRLVAPLGLGFGHRPPDIQTDASDAHRSAPNNPAGLRRYLPGSSQTATHRTGIPIAALDISPQKTHAILAGKEILKTIRIDDCNVVEELNLRSAVTSYASTHNAHKTGTDVAFSEKDYLPSADVKWSHSQHDSHIISAGSNGRIVLYDIRRPEVELARLHEHSRQVHRLAINPFKSSWFLSGGHDSSIKFWDTQLLAGDKGTMTMPSQKTLYGRADAIRDIRWSPRDGTEFAICTDSGVIQQWDFRNLSGPALRLNAHEKACYAIDWHPDGKHLASAGLDRSVKIWDCSTGQRRQRPSLVLKTPQAVMKVRWRPAEYQLAGDLLCNQLVTSYNLEDPRLHIWDLRSPLVPIREIDRYRTPPTDLLWHSRDLLWTVGNEGMFTQNDAEFASQVSTKASFCPKTWIREEELFTYSEKVDLRRISSFDDRALMRLGNVQGRRGSEEATAASHSTTDEENMYDNFNNAFIRRPGKVRGPRYLLSQENTPPSREESPPVRAFDRSLPQDSFNDGCQVGVRIDMDIATEGDLAFQFLADNCAKPVSRNHGLKQSDDILDRLDRAFNVNAKICEEMSQHQTSQSWRILRAIIVADLGHWAEQNRDTRLRESQGAIDMVTRTARKPITRTSSKRSIMTEVHERNKGSQNLKTKSVADSSLLEPSRNKGLRDVDTTSNMTTPLARAQPDSPLPERASRDMRHQRTTDSSHDLDPLPPSLLNAHSTAAAASDALKENGYHASSTHSHSASSSPPSSQNSSPVSTQTSAHAHGPQAEATRIPINLQQASSQRPQVLEASAESDVFHPKRFLDTAAHQAHENNQMEALRDYRAQGRPILNYEAPSEADPNNPATLYRYDSSESFPMFSASTDSSHRIRSLQGSYGSPELTRDRTGNSTQWEHPAQRSRFKELEPSSPSSVSRDVDRRDRILQGRNNHGPPRQTGDISFDERDIAFGFDGTDEPPTTMDSIPDTEGSSRNTGRFSSFGTKENSLAASPTGSSLEQFRMSPQIPSKSRDEPSVQPMFPKVLKPASRGKDFIQNDSEDLSSPNFIFRDFQRPKSIDIAACPPKARSPWPVLPILLSCLETDLQGRNGTTYCQFSAQLLFQILPFYFWTPLEGEEDKSRDFDPFTKRMLNPDTFNRTLNTIFFTYHESLKAHDLPIAAAEVRNFCQEHGLTLFQDSSEESNQSDLSYFVFASCPHCAAPLGGNNASPSTCTQCRLSRDPCPICLSVQPPSDTLDIFSLDTPLDSEFSTDGAALWTSCQACGHGGHSSCLISWLELSDSEGICPTPNCGHDCAPGRVREERVEEQRRVEAEARLLRGSAALSAKADALKVRGGSGAVDRTRKVLAASAGGSGSAGAAVLSGSGSGSSGRKQVRLMTPMEESRI
ncbi:MAG: hypothetical protein Q9227_000062 [Pyrenula ochraceoflavens]